MNKNLGIEITAVMLLTVGRSIANNLAAIYWLGDPPIRPFGYFQFTECLRGLYLIGLVLFIVSLKKESWTELGLTTSFGIKDILIALFLIFMTMLVWIVVASLIEKLGFIAFQKPHSPFVGPSAAGESLWIGVSAVVVGFGEELLIRGYLISRLLRVCGPKRSVIYSSLLFSGWHISQGVFSVVHTFIWGLVYGWTFTKIRRLYPFALAHAINNMIAFLWA
ncbi:MAG: hypothetical protein A3H27_03675 [Acidobacteria bacterium RIFCSPLOWO2_02_FULL_59_13]|nr:MAG: hypothetical protein A3H27_03675 [Acidobacteria bacterium RIFCSPLOWO2_02_FULL_59_13]